MLKCYIIGYYISQKYLKIALRINCYPLNYIYGRPILENMSPALFHWKHLYFVKASFQNTVSERRLTLKRGTAALLFFFCPDSVYSGQDDGREVQQQRGTREKVTGLKVATEC